MKYTMILLSLAFLSCSAPSNEATVDTEKIRQEILAIHENSIQAHWDKNPAFFIKNLAEDYVTVSRGEIKKQTSDEIFIRFNNYLSKTDFLEYKDTHEPIVGFSKDGSVAWIIVQVQVTGLQKNEENKTDTIKFKSAWISLFEKQNDVWMMKTNVSN